LKHRFSKDKNSRISAKESFNKRKVKGDEYQGSQENGLTHYPTSSLIIHNYEYSIGYDLFRRTPAWVSQHLTAKSIEGQVKRSIFDFKEDERIPQHLRATPTDYTRSGFDRGHMAPTADYRSSHKAMHETFYMTNICPQWPKLNRGYWAKLEKHVRDLTNHYAHVYVTTGPLFLPFIERNKRYVKYQVIGKNRVAVPTHFFKYIKLEDEKGKKEIRAYILPNKEIPLETPLEQFKTTVQRIERAAGLILP
jgi:endonuclease G